jgi:hypothetical protein
MRFSIVCAGLLLQAVNSFAQLQEHFNYTHINNAVIWRGSDTAWQISDGTLQSKSHKTGNVFYISTYSSLSAACSWEWWMKLDFNTSSLNYVDVYLISNVADLVSDSVRGYFVRIGNTKDEVSLYRKDATASLLIDGADGVTNHTSSILRIKVVRNTLNEFSLYTNDIKEGSAVDGTYKTSSYMGMVVKQSVASFFDKHYFDDVIIKKDSTDNPPDTTGIEDIVVNEILYDGTPEFVEIYNNGREAVDLKKLFLTRRTSENKVALSTTTSLLLPGQYAAFTDDPDKLCLNYSCSGNIYKVNLPALVNKEGSIILMADNEILDSLHYSDDMHSPLVDLTKGVSLERIDANKPTDDKSNWQSAAETSGFATPGKVNSQRVVETAMGFSVSPEVFSPDVEKAVISYSLPVPGYIANISIYDASGRRVKDLFRTTSLATKGQLFWDGRADSNKMSAKGVYIVFIEIFDGKGDVRRWKLPVVLAGRLN